MNNNFFLGESSSQVIVVMPCLNEEKKLANTCASLGFGIGKDKTPKNCILILVDNNSTDATAQIANHVKQNSIIDSVFIKFEKDKGYVFARHSGNLLAKLIADANNWNPENVLILQADADTLYSENYAFFMQKGSSSFGSNFLIEARIEPCNTSNTTLKSYLDLCMKIDKKFFAFFNAENYFDFIIDDKVAGYLLSDYIEWGGHIREYSISGEEQFAETTRLYIKSKSYDAKRGTIDDAFAIHSMRKIFFNPILHLASAGFPRGDKWNSKFQQINLTIEQLTSFPYSKYVELAIQSRKLTLIAIFYMLPLHINKILAVNPDEKFSVLNNYIIPHLPKRTADDLKFRPGYFLQDAFEITERCELEISLFCNKVEAF